MHHVATGGRSCALGRLPKHLVTRALAEGGRKLPASGPYFGVTRHGTDASVDGRGEPGSQISVSLAHLYRGRLFPVESPPKTTGPGLRTHLSSAGASGGDAIPLKAGFQTASVLSRGSLRPGRTGDAALRPRDRADTEPRAPAVAQVIPGAQLLAPPSRVLNPQSLPGTPDQRPRDHGRRLRAWHPTGSNIHSANICPHGRLRNLTS